MKIQDAVFLTSFIFLLWRFNFKIAVVLGLGCLILAIPLFAAWTFFTADRLTFYAAAFFLQTIIFQLWQSRKSKL